MILFSRFGQPKNSSGKTITFNFDTSGPEGPTVTVTGGSGIGGFPLNANDTASLAPCVVTGPFEVQVQWATGYDFMTVTRTADSTGATELSNVQAGNLITVSFSAPVTDGAMTLSCYADN